MKKENLIDVALGNKKADLVLKNARIVNTISGEIYESSVAVVDGTVAGVHPDYCGVQEIDCSGKYVVPGFIDGHVHIESSMLSVREFARAVVPRGTTTIIADPHEITNVAGVDGIKYILESSENVPLNVYIMLPSCVPATNLETSGASLNAEDLKPLLGIPRVIGLGEFMNFPGVLYKVPEVMDKLNIAESYIIDGHAPYLTGKELCAYVAAGVSSDHECTSVAEALEKLRLGMYIMIREGSATKNLRDLLPLVNKFNSRKCILATDDRHPDEILNEGHIDHIVKSIIQEQGNIIRGIRLATLNAAEHYGLKHLGGIAPGYTADLLVIDNFNDFNIQYVIKDGFIVAENGKPLFESMPEKKTLSNCMNPAEFTLESFLIPAQGDKIRVIGIVPDQIVTEHLTETALVINGNVCADPSRDISKLCVIERHHATGNIGKGFVKGLGIKTGALATSVAHDSHNIIVAGADDESMLIAARYVVESGGGIAVVKDKKVIESMALPIAGLMTNKTAETVSEKTANLHSACKKLGISLTSPFLTLSFLALPVIPELKLTDKGLVDISKFDYTSLFTGD